MTSRQARIAVLEAELAMARLDHTGCNEAAVARYYAAREALRRLLSGE